jgi:iron complex transport system substrate-binding protein
MRIVSLAPAATEIVFALGLGEELVGRSHLCDHPPEALEVPVVTAARGEGTADRPRDIHDRVRMAGRSGTPLARLDPRALREARPDVILTQSTCGAWAVSAGQATEAARELPGEVTVVSLDPVSIEGIFNAISTVGAFAEAEDEAVGLLELLRSRLGVLEDRVLERRLAGVPPRRAVVLEWLDPPFASGHWLPEMVRRAGGWEVLGREGERSVETSWDQVRQVDPDVIVAAPCGSDAEEAAAAFELVEFPAWFDQLRAVREGELFAVDADALFGRPGPRVIDGIGLLAELFDPEGMEGSAPEGSWVPLGIVGVADAGR